MQEGAIPELRTPTVAVKSPASPDSQVASDYCRNRANKNRGRGEVGSGAHHDAGDWARAAQEAPVAGGAGRCCRGGGSGGGGAAERHVESGKGKDSRKRKERKGF